MIINNTSELKDMVKGSLSKIPIIGRNQELKILKSIYNKVKKGNGEFCLITGSKGIGKSKILDEYIKHSQNNNSLVLYYKSFPDIVEKPFECI